MKYLEAALARWKDDATAYTGQCVQPVLYNRAGVVDTPKQTANVAADAQTARDWKKDTFDEGAIKRPGTESGFLKEHAPGASRRSAARTHAGPYNLFSRPPAREGLHPEYP